MHDVLIIVSEFNFTTATSFLMAIFIVYVD